MAEQRSPAQAGKIKMLLLAARAGDDGSEAVLLAEKLTEICGAYVDLRSVRVQNVAAVLTAAGEFAPDVIHFYGDCTANGRFQFIDNAGDTADWCSKSSLLKKIGALPHETKLVYFNGRVTAQELAAGNGRIAALVGMEKRSDAALSRQFVLPFYTALYFGNSLGAAFAVTWQALPEEKRRNHEAVMLRFRRDINPDRY
jgi:hypothetical protein